MMLQTHVDDSILQAFTSMKMGKGSYKDHKMLVLAMNENALHIDEELSNASSLEALAEQLPMDHTRYICYHLHFEKPASSSLPDTASEGLRSKIIFIVWCPSKVSVKEKFQVAATSKTVKDKLNGIFVTHHASSKSDLEEGPMIERCLAIMK
ncbi:hypothetical protein FDP41_004103 [Naegleria fowleri]|uniref:ADF-H domain-containing protein n=1 Tax=Naegleria fowleri TaxID=5763 RepID=A0A6A5BRP9_NAEFO|nr:uncharacterized protein FDP41_004103 [Naegleria fowleri]KAF0976808.1 hypothetical protein FDP41_004103 [Naegleria fowleri]CAG4714286.1 unnamed protein product [Naegleria fowleri]